jgi:hypothetical protein
MLDRHHVISQHFLTRITLGDESNGRKLHSLQITPSHLPPLSPTLLHACFLSPQPPLHSPNPHHPSSSPPIFTIFT